MARCQWHCMVLYTRGASYVLDFPNLASLQYSTPVLECEYEAAVKRIKMATEAQGRVQQAVEKMLNEVEKQSLRPLLTQSHMCAAKCYENMFSGKAQTEQCVQKCFYPAQQVQEFIGKELNNFQDRLGRCARQCQDQVQDKVDSSTTHAEVTSLQQQLDTCVVECCNTHVDLVPRIMNRINELLGQFSKNDQ